MAEPQTFGKTFMPSLFEDEKRFPDNGTRKNFVFLAYPYTPPIALDDYRNVTKELQAELGIRLWYFLDELTTTEMMRKVWRAILRADLCFFDISGGNPNVALELGLSIAIDKRCIPVMKTGEANPLGKADLGYAERSEYQSAATLKNQLRTLVKAKSSAYRLYKEISYEIQSDAFQMSREEIEAKIEQIVHRVFDRKKITREEARKIAGDDGNAGVILNALREKGVLKVEPKKRYSYWLFTDSWVHHDHEVVGT